MAENRKSRLEQCIRRLTNGDPDARAELIELAYERLPDEEKEVFGLVWYQGLTQAEVAKLLGVSERTIGRRWQLARRTLYQRLGGRLPE